jgi:ABC-type sugar transport system substrate-binding protein
MKTSKSLHMVIALGIFMVIILGIAGCSRTSSTTASEKKTYTIGFVSIDFANISVTQQARYMKKRCDELGIAFQMVDSKRDTNTLLQCVENFRAAGVDAMILPAYDANVPSDTIKAAKDAGIIIVVQENPLPDPDAYNAWSGRSAVETGRGIGQNACNWIKKTFDPNERVEVALCYNPGYPLSANRMSGVKEVLAKECPNAVIVAEENAVTVQTGVAAGENFIQAYPNLRCVISATDNGTLGVYEAFTAAGKVGDKVGLFACDLNAQAQVVIKDKTSIYRGTIGQNMNGVGVQIIDAIYAALNGKDYPKEILYDVTLITHDNIDQYLQDHPTEMPLEG